MDSKVCDVLIIGAGPAGLTAGLYAARAGKKTLIIESLVSGGAVNLTPDIENFPGFMKIDGHELGKKMYEQTIAAGAEVLFDEIESINLESKTAKTATAEICSKAIIIASGASPRKLGVPGEDDFWGAGVHTCGLCDGAFYKGKNIVVVGGGNSAVEEAIYMAGIARTVTIVNNTPGFNAQAVLVDKLMTMPNVKKIYHSATVSKFVGDGKLKAIEIATPRRATLTCDGVFLAIGRTPNSAVFGEVLKLSPGGYIAVDNKMRTNIAGVFAAGDVCDKYLRQIITACADGAVAAQAACEYINM